MLKNVLYFASVVELGTGLVLIINPALVVALLLGADISGVGIALGMCFGITLLALGLACWPRGSNVQTGSPAFWGMLAYNALIALLLVDLFVVGHFAGVLLWPAVALHAAVAVLLLWTRRSERSAKAAG
jgi:Ca2+/Na+ antiporter